MHVRLPHIRNSKKAAYAAGFVSSLLLLSLTVLGAAPVQAATDCDDNAIIKCGVTSPTDFINHVKANDNKNGKHDLQALYAHHGLSAADYATFVKNAQPGTAYKDGRIVVDGKVVATGAKSLGRIASYHGTGYFTETV